MKKIVHALLVIIAAVPWAIAVTCGAVCLALVVIADKVWPNATWGNCWSYAGANWYKHGGYLLVRAADTVRLMGIGWIPHALWVKELNDEVKLEHTAPLRRGHARYFPWMIFYFPYEIKPIEEPHDAVM